MRIRPCIVTAALLTLSAQAFAQTAAPVQNTPAQTVPAQAVPTQSPPTMAQQDPEARALIEKFRAACGADLQTHCANIERGTEQGRAAMRQCVEMNKVKFSAGCQAAIAERNAHRHNAPAADKPKS